MRFIGGLTTPTTKQEMPFLEEMASLKIANPVIVICLYIQIFLFCEPARLYNSIPSLSICSVSAGSSMVW